ncbi:MAG TPA: phosphoesterase PA-phosphatase [Sphingobacteriaceae bacterium]|nr:phosphoesterase PA-phosphatase [Sphingobacteriaceae bacterium]
MISTAKKLYRRSVAGIMLLTVEMLLSIFLFLIAFAVFIFIAKYIFLDKKDAFDADVSHFMTTIVSTALTHILLFFTILGNSQFLFPANILLTCYFLFVRKHKWYSIKIPSIALSSVILMSLLKLLFTRPRPLVPLLEAAKGFSFPSGHAMSSVTFFGLLIYFVWQTKMNKYLRVLIVTCLVLLILIIGFSRIYLRVHYASDVIAGFCAGIIWLVLSLWTIRKIEFYSKRNLNKVVEHPSASPHSHAKS